MIDTLFKIKVADKALEKVFDQNNIMQLVIYATKFKLKNKNITLVSIHNIQSELEENELQAWQKLIRVLTHEILNSMTPIVSLSATAKDLLGDVFSRFKVDFCTPDQTALARDQVEPINGRRYGEAGE